MTLVDSVERALAAQKTKAATGHRVYFEEPWSKRASNLERQTRDRNEFNAGHESRVGADQLFDLDTWTEATISQNVSVKFEHDADDERPNLDMLDTVATEEFGAWQALTNAERMAIENNLISFEITHRFWKVWLIDTLVQTGHNTGDFIERMEYVNSLTDSDEAKAWYIETERRVDVDNRCKARFQ